MNILLVDDDSYVLEALQKSLDWDSMGIENVYSAQSVNKAKKIICDIPIHILVCDIEMPKENGFELLKWMKQKEYIIKDILLTSYAEFKYATEAIRYSCYAYALKPIDYEELEKMITGAIAEEKKALSLVNHDKYLEYWTVSEKIRKEQFFSDLLLNNQQVNFRGYGVDYKENQLFLPLIINYYVEGEDINNGYGRGMFEWTLKNLIAEIFTANNYSMEAALHMKNNSYLAIIRLNSLEDRQEIAENAAVSLLRKVARKLEIVCSIIIGKANEFKHLKSDVNAFNCFLKKALIEPDTIMSLNDYMILETRYKVPDFNLWESFLKNRQVDAMKREIDKYLDKQLAFHNLDKEVLKNLVMNFIQLLVTILKESGTITYLMGNFLFDTGLIDFSTQNVTNAKKGLHQMIDTVMNILNGDAGDKSTVKIVKDYIDNNLDNEITRESLADMVYLNQDYLARIFKKETGESIGNYITRKRVDRAKEYLVKTKESVNTIALRVGYDNFSYFTKVFKNSAGVTPKEFRRDYQKED